MSSVLDYMKSSLALVNHKNIENHKDEFVIVHGKAQGVKNNTLTLLVSQTDNKTFLINNVTKNIPAEEFVMITGKVESDNSLEFVDFIKLSKDFDLDFVNELIDLLQEKTIATFFD